MSTFESRQKALRSFRSHSHKFLTTSALTAAGLVSMGITAANAQNVAPDALPQGAEVTRGAATFDYSVPNTLTIDQQASLTSAEYKGGFNIGSNAAVLMLQESGDIFVHIDKSNNTSFLEGLFSGSGSNFVLNKNGVIVTGTARIDMNSFVASTAASLDLDRLERDGHAVFTDFGEGKIVIEEGARVTVAEAGLAAFVSPFVSNAGVINAKMGTVAIGAGETVTLDLYGDGLVELAVDGELEDALIENTGTISAEGGNVQISARAAKGAVDNVINVDGIVTASSASVQGGKIVLSGGSKGTVKVGGTVDASGEGAGSIDVTGENIEIADTAELTADGGTNGDGGDIKIIASDKAIFRGSVSAKGGTESGKGGFVETSGHGYISVGGGTVDTRAADGTAGWWLIDPADITIVDGTTGGDFAPVGATSTIGWSDIETALVGSNVTITTANGTGGSGDITFDDPGLTGAGGSVNATEQNRTLEFNADRDIIVNDNISLSNVGTTILNALGDVVFNQNFITHDLHGDATTAGNLTVNAGDDISVNSGATVGANASAGNVSFDAGNDIDVSGSVMSVGGDINLYQAGVLTAADNSIINSGMGKITLQQNEGGLIQDAIDAISNSGDGLNKVNVGAGTFNEKLLVDKSLHLRGVNRQSTFIDTSGFGGYGLQVTADDVTLDRFTLQDDGTSTYGIKATGDDLDLRVLLVRGFGRSEVDLNGVDGATLTSVIADGQNTAGVGIALSNVNNVTMTNVRTRDNNWGGVGLYDTVNGATTNVTLDAASSAQLMEDNPIYIDAQYGHGVSGLELPGFDFAVRNPSHRDGIDARGEDFIYFQRTEQDAFDFAVGLDNAGATIGSSVEGVGADADSHVTYTNEFFVGEDAFGTSMFINPAVEEADAGATINVRAGTYEGTVNIDKSLNLYGAQMGNDARSGRVGADESVILGDVVVAKDVDGLTVDGFTIQNQGDAASGEKASLYLGNNVANINVLNNIFDGQDTVDARSGIVTSSAGVEDVLIQNNLFTDARYGIYVNRNANNVDIVSNNFDTNRHGVVIQDGGADTHIRGNAFLNNTGSGVYVWSANGFVSTIGTLNNNRFRDNGQHIFYLDGNAPDLLVDGSTGNTFYSNGGFKTTDAMTEAELFALEDLVTHKMDDLSNGLVVFTDGALFVTQNTGGIQHAINIADAGDTVNVDGTEYQEDLTIDKELKLTGHGTTLQSNGAANLITVTAANVNIDPFIFNGFDGLGTADYGIFASGAGANGLVVDGNTFRNFTNAGVYVEGQSGSTGTIIDNTFEGSSTVGVETGVMKGNYVLNIEGNTFGSLAEKIVTGVKVFRLISGGTVNIADSALNQSTIHSSGDGVRFVQGLRDRGHASITGVDIVSDGNAVDVEQKARKNSTLSISGGSFEGGSNGIKLSGVDERGTITIEDATIKGEAGILSDTTSIGGSLTIDNNTVEGTDGNAIELAAGVNGGTVQIINNDNIKASESGIVIGGELQGDADITIDRNRVRFATNGAGIDVSDATFGGLANLDVTRNSVWKSGTDGIILSKTSNALVENNNIGYYGSGLTLVSGTDVIGGDGIDVADSDGAVVKTNHIINTGESGIQLQNTDDSFVQGNTVDDAGVAGIRVVSSDNVTVNLDNKIDGTHNAGIGLDSVTNSLIDGNEISNTGGSGVWMKDSDGTTVSGNIIDGTWKRAGAGTGSGVHVLSTDNATVSGNTIDNTNRGGNGVYADSSDNLKVNGNFIGTVGGNISGNGVAIDGAKTAEVNGNEIKNAAKNGIKFIKGIKDGAVDVIGNDIDVTMSGIVFGSASPSVDGSTVYVISNTVVAGDDAVRFDDAIVDSTVELNGNTLTANSEGVDVMGAVTDSRVTLGGNVADPGYAFAFQTINADDNGVVFRGDVTGSQIYMPRQQITALDGEAVLFKGIVDNSRVGIGHGEGDYGGVWLSNVNGFFTGSDTGVLFEDNVQNSSVIEIVNTTVTGQGGEAVHFEGDVDDSSVLIAGSNLNGQDGDAVLFEGAVTNGAAVRIGNGTATPLPLYTAAFGPFPLSYGGNTITGSENGIVFNGVNGGSSVTIANNSKIEGQNNDGIVFNGASPSISGGSNVTITGNTQILADNDGIKVEDDITGSATQLNIRNNKIVAGEDGIDIDNVRNRASVEIGGSSYSRDGNWIIAGDDGIEFDAGIDSTVLIQKNRIDAGDDGIDIADDDKHHTTSIDSRAVVSILDNKIGSEGRDTIGDDGIVIDENITGGATLTISGNSIGRSGAKVGDDGIDLDNISGGATVNIVNNPNNYASDNGINVSGSINGATLNITGNNHGIHADDHGIYVGGAVYGGSTVNIHDNIISANEDDGSTGDGIHFAGNIYTANINIGNGGGDGVYDDPSNFIRGKDGIHFAGKLNSGTKVNINGNRIGYGKRSYGRYPIFSDAVSDDGIQFAEDIQGSASVKITDNYIKSDDDGVSFLDDIQDDARVLIGGRRDGNTIDAGDEGIQFEDEIKNHSLLEVSYNDIDADDNGIQFDGETSNHIHSGHGEEILIKKNSIVGGEHGIVFNGTASNWRHDIVIRDNSLIKGEDENGITHVGNIDDAELWVLNNGEIDGEEDGIHLEGYFYNGAKITIEGNGWDGGVRGRDDDGIHVADNGRDYGSDVLIKNNHVHHTGDDGIYVRNVKGVKIIENDIHDTGKESRDGDGIYVKDSDYALIKKNDITGAGRDGINVYSSYRADILFNDIYAEGGNRYGNRGQMGAGRDGIHVEYSDKVDIIGNDITADLGYDKYYRRRNIGGAVNQLGAGRHGIYVKDSDYADVKFNDVLGDVKTYRGFPIASVDSVGENGIYVYKSDHADVYFNDVERTGENGIKLRKGAFGDIKFNTVDRAGDDGIDVEYGAFVDIIGNKVSKSGDDGIDVEDSKFADIKFNKVTDSRRDGIEVDDSKYTDIKYNLVVGAGDDGIDVDDSKFVDIEYNLISFTKGDGIQVHDSFGADIMRNLVAFAGDDGIDVEDSSYVDVNGNLIRFVKRNGIEVSGGKQADIIGNNIRFVGGDGINVRNVYSMYNRGFDVVINENTVRDAGDDGIEVKYSGDTQIDFNTVTDVDDDGIRVYNPRGSFIMSYPDMYDDGPSMNIARVSAYPYYEFVPANVEITNNTVTNAGTDGIEVTAYDVQLLADTNTVIDSGENGILLNALGGYSRYEDRIGDNIQTVSLVSKSPYPPMGMGYGSEGPGVFNSVLIDNGVQNSGTNGVHAKGYGHGDVVLEGNTLVDNPVGARFESGAIDLTNLENPNTIIVNPDYELPEGYDFVTGLQFELAGTTETVASANSLTIVDETLGATAFTGFINRDVDTAFYVRFEDGAILDEFGNVIEINGEQVNFDGFVPLDNQDALGNISPTALEAIEDRLYDADDSPFDQRGQIFIGTPAVAGLDNVQDFFQQFSEFAPGFGGFSLTLLGMPPVTQPLAGLNSIGTFAGGEDLNNINPAAGGEGGEGFNDIEPAAGNASSCWSDVVNAPANGGVNFNFSGDPTENLNAAASCGS